MPPAPGQTPGQTATAGQLLSILQSDLRSLCVESRRRFPDVKKAAELASSTVLSGSKAAAEGNGGGGGESSVLSDQDFEAAVRPFILACETRDPKLALIGVGCLQKLIAQNVAPPALVGSFLETACAEAAAASPSSSSSSSTGARAKALQTVIALLMSERYALRRAELGRALSVCLTLSGGGQTTGTQHSSGGSNLLRDTAVATLRQAVALLSDRATDAAPLDQPAAEEGAGKERSSAIQLLTCVVDELCLAVGRGGDGSGEGRDGRVPWLSITEPEPCFLLELVEVALATRPNKLAEHGPMLQLLRATVCPLLTKVLTNQPPFQLMHRAMRLVWIITRDYHYVLLQECDTLLRTSVAFLPARVRSPTDKSQHIFENNTPLWQRTLVTELYSLLFASGDVMREYASIEPSDPAQPSLIVLLVQSLVDVVEYGITVDKVFPSPASSLRLVSLQIATGSEPNESATFSLSLAIGAALGLGRTICNPYTSLDATIETESHNVGVLTRTWELFLQMLSLVLQQCNQTEMVQAILAVHVHLIQALAAGGAPLVQARDAAFKALVDCAIEAHGVGRQIISSKNVVVCAAIFEAVGLISRLSSGTVTSSATDSPVIEAPWLLVLELCEEVQAGLGGLNTLPKPNGQVSDTEKMQLVSALDSFFADSALLCDASYERLVAALGAVLVQQLAKKQPIRPSAVSLGGSGAQYHCFTVESFPRIFKHNLHRMWRCWDVMIGHLHDVIKHSAQHVSNQGVDALFQVIQSAILHEPDQCRIFQPLVVVSKLPSAETMARFLTGFHTILLESSAHLLTSGWVTVLTIIQRCANFNAPQIVAAAFESVQLIVSDFLSYMPVEYFQLCVLTVSHFRSRHAGVNVSLTALGQLWHIADWIGETHNTLTAALERVVARGDNPTPAPIHSVMSLDSGAMSHMAGEFAIPEETHERPSPINKLWRTLFHEMQRGASDLRPEVRKCAVQTLFSTLTSHGKLFSPSQWHEYLWQLVFPVLGAVHAASLASAASEKNCDSASLTTGPDGDSQYPMLIHHSRNTVGKQWDETNTLVLGGATRLVCQYFTQILSLESYLVVWNILLEFIEGSLLGSEEVALAGIEALTNLAKCIGASSATAATHEGSVLKVEARVAAVEVELSAERRQTLLSATLGMVSDVVGALAITSSAIKASRRQPTWVRMPLQPKLTSKVVLRLMECVTGLRAYRTPDNLIVQARVVDRLVHASTQFEQPTSFIVTADGKERAVLALSSAQETGLGCALPFFPLELCQPRLKTDCCCRWMRQNLQIADPSAEVTAEAGRSTTDGLCLLLLCCLRLLPGGVTTIALGGGHPLLSDLAPVRCSLRVPLAQGALDMLLQAFDVGHALSSQAARSVTPGKSAGLFALTVRVLRRCTQAGSSDVYQGALGAAVHGDRRDDWTLFRSRCLRGLLTLVGHGLSHSRSTTAHCSSSHHEYELVCEELGMLAATTLYSCGTYQEEEEQEEEGTIPTGVKTVRCIVAGLRCPAFDKAPLPDESQLRLLHCLASGAERHENRSSSSVADSCFDALFELGAGEEHPGAGNARVSQLVAPILFRRCEEILHRYLEHYRSSGPHGLPVPRWQTAELLRLLHALCNLPPKLLSDGNATAPDPATNCRLLTQLLPRLCEVIALGADVNGQVRLF